MIFFQMPHHNALSSMNEILVTASHPEHQYQENEKETVALHTNESIMDWIRRSTAALRDQRQHDELLAAKQIYTFTKIARLAPFPSRLSVGVAMNLLEVYILRQHKAAPILWDVYAALLRGIYADGEVASRRMAFGATISPLAHSTISATRRAPSHRKEGRRQGLTPVMQWHPFFEIAQHKSEELKASHLQLAALSQRLDAYESGGTESVCKVLSEASSSPEQL